MTTSGPTDILRAKGDYDGALKHHQQALEIWEYVLGTDHPKTIRAREIAESVLSNPNR